MTGHRTFTEAELYPFLHRDADRRPSEAHLYVVETSSGVVKVGYSIRPRQRIYQYTFQAAVYNCRITACWVSAPHGNFVHNESELMKCCSERSTDWHGFEYFRGVQFEDAVADAEALSFDRGPEVAVRFSPTAFPHDSTETVCTRLSLPRKAVLKLAKAGELCRVNVGGVLRFERRSVDAYLRRHLPQPEQVA